MRKDTSLWVTIMAGGRGSRFWPWSQSDQPKQFLTIPPLVSKESLLQATYRRVRQWVAPQRILVVGLAEHAKQLRQQLPKLPKQNLLLEPFGRNTAASVAFAAALIRERGGEQALQWVLPADHHIVDDAILGDAMQAAALFFQRRGCLMTFGIEPRWPETGYGYIEIGESLGRVQGVELFAAASFREKPDLAKAAQYVQSKHFLWNSGIFIWPVETILDEMRQHAPKIANNAIAMGKLFGGKGVQPLRLPKKFYEPLESISSDYAVMDKSQRVCVIRTPLSWRDLGG